MRLKMRERTKGEFLAALRKELSTIPGMVIIIGQPLSHRIDHMLSGTRANIAVKLFGDDLYQLRASAEEIRKVVAKVRGAVDVSVEQQVDIPQLFISFDRERIARYGLRTGELAEVIETAFAGEKVSQVLDGQRTYDVVVRYRDDQRASMEAIGNTLIDTPAGAKVPLKMLATVRQDLGPNVIMRDNVQRRIVVMANVGDRDLRGIIDDIRAGIEREVKLPQGYYVVYGGQFESESEASRTISFLGLFVIAGIFLLLFLAFRSVRTALLIMVNLPLALIGGVVGDLARRRHPERRLAGGLHHPLRHRNPQRHHDGLALRVPPGARGSLARGGGGAWLTRATLAHPDDRALRRARPHPARPCRRQAGQRDPGADGRGHPRRAALLDGAQHAGRARALHALREAQWQERRQPGRGTTRAGGGDGLTVRPASGI